MVSDRPSGQGIHLDALAQAFAPCHALALIQCGRARSDGEVTRKVRQSHAEDVVETREVSWLEDSSRASSFRGLHRFWHRRVAIEHSEEPSAGALGGSDANDRGHAETLS